MSEINRRHFLAAGAGVALLPAAVAASSSQDDRASMKERIDVNAPVEDNLIAQYLKPKKLSIAVGAAKPFMALHFSDSHISMADPADILWGTSKELRLYEARNNGSLGEAGFPYAVQSLAAVIAYAKRRNIPLLNTGDIIDFRSEANIACLSRSLKGLDIFSSLGNHEGRGLHARELLPQNQADDDALRVRFEQAIGNPLLVASRVINGVKFVAFDNCGLARYRRAEQFERIKAEFEQGLPSVLMCHMPPFSTALHEAKCAYHVRIGRSRPAANNLSAYYMMDVPFEKSSASSDMKRILDFLRGRKNLKAILCGHLHMEWHGVFGEGVPVHVAGRGFNGECYEISFV
ncbi:MAG: metallophosphoesterase [Kiritimatiellae bacterium]|nr:metallophosphoesterase [Kiritimatiellia bacterium]